MGTSPSTADTMSGTDTEDLAERIAAMPAEDRNALAEAMDDLRFAGLPQSYAEDLRHEPGVVSTELTVPVPRTKPTTTTAGAPLVPVADEIAMLGQMSVTLCAADSVPKALKGKPNDVFLILLTARDLGVDLTTAIREFHVVEGKVTLSPKVKLAMVRRQGLGRVWPDPHNSDEEATWYAVRYDYGEDQVFAFTFTMADAKRAKLTDKGEKSAWSTYPQRMLSWRALGYLLDDVFSEVGAGLYSPDEMGAVVDDDGRAVLDVTEVDPIRGTEGPRNRPRNRAADRQRDPELISDADRERLGGLIDHVRELPEAKDALVAAWSGADDDVREACPRCKPDRGCDEHRALWPLKQLPAGDEDVAEARIRSVVLRLAAGEFLPPGESVPPWVAEYLGADAVSPQEASDEPEGPDTPDTPDEASTDEQGLAGDQLEGDEPEAEVVEPEGEPDDATVTALIDHLKAMTKPELVKELEHRKLPTSGVSDALRTRLGEAMLTEGWAPPQPQLGS